jgi:hypothetical protein
MKNSYFPPTKQKEIENDANLHIETLPQKKALRIIQNQHLYRNA